VDGKEGFYDIEYWGGGGREAVPVHAMKAIYGVRRYTAIPRLTKIISSGITFVSRNIR